MEKERLNGNGGKSTAFEKTRTRCWNSWGKAPQKQSKKTRPISVEATERKLKFSRFQKRKH